jgi:hypothetical protein
MREIIKDGFETTKKHVVQHAESIRRATGAVAMVSMFALAGSLVAGVLQGRQHEIDAEDYSNWFDMNVYSLDIGESRAVGKKDIDAIAVADVQVYENLTDVTRMQDAMHSTPLLGGFIPEPAKRKVTLEADTTMHFESCESSEVTITFGTPPSQESLGNQPLDQQNILGNDFLVSDTELLRCHIGTIAAPSFDYPAGTVERPETYQVFIDRE